MTTESVALRAELSFRIRTGAPAEWPDFVQLWMAFNAIYGGEPDARERNRVMASIRSNFGEAEAFRVLVAITPSANRLVQLPPANLLLNRENPGFRTTSRQYAALYRNRAKSAVLRLAAIGGVLYQIRCNLLHGSKDPGAARDRMLVHESVIVLRELVPALEAAVIARTAA